MSTPLIDGIIVDAYADGETNWGATMNQNLVRTGWMLFRAVKTVGNNAPVAGADNDRHIVGIAPTGAWAGHPAEMARQNIATFGGWDFLVLPNDADVINYGDNNYYRKTAGVWTVLVQPAGPPSGAAGGDLTLTYPNPDVRALAITDAKVAAANKDGLAAVPSLRTLGLGAQQALAGNTVIPVNQFRQSLAAAQLVLASVALATYANLLTIPITVAAGGILLINARIAANGTSNNTSMFARIRIDGAVGDVTVVGRGAQSNQIAAASTEANVGVVLRVTGLAPGAHTVNLDWRSSGANTFTISPILNPDRDSATMIVEEVGV